MNQYSTITRARTEQSLSQLHTYASHSFPSLLCLFSPRPLSSSLIGHSNPLIQARPFQSSSSSSHSSLGSIRHSSSASSASSSPPPPPPAPSAPSDYLNKFYFLVHPDRFAALEKQNHEKQDKEYSEFLSALIKTNGDSLGRLLSLSDYLKNSQAPGPPPLVGAHTMKFFINKQTQSDEAMSKHSFEELIVHLHVERGASRDQATPRIQQAIYRLIVGAKIEIPSEIEQQWKKEWEGSRHHEQADDSDSVPVDPLARLFSPSLQSLLRRSPEVRPQIARLREAGQVEGVDKALNWNSDRQSRDLVREMAQQGLIHFPPSLPASSHASSLAWLAQRLAAPVAQESIHAWLGVSVHFIADSKLECTRTDWYLPIDMSHKEFQQFLVYWLAQYERNHLVKKQESEQTNEGNMNFSKGSPTAKPVDVNAKLFKNYRDTKNSKKGNKHKR